MLRWAVRLIHKRRELLTLRRHPHGHGRTYEEPPCSWGARLAVAFMPSGAMLRLSHQLSSARHQVMKVALDNEVFQSANRACLPRATSCQISEPGTDVPTLSPQREIVSPKRDWIWSIFSMQQVSATSFMITGLGWTIDGRQLWKAGLGKNKRLRMIHTVWRVRNSALEFPGWKSNWFLLGTW